MTPDDLEGRLLAQRRILQLIVAALAGTPAGERIRERLGERATMQDGQEDPGAVETAGMAVELAVADEFRRIAEGIPDFAGGEAGVRSLAGGKAGGRSVSAAPEAGSRTSRGVEVPARVEDPAEPFAGNLRGALGFDSCPPKEEVPMAKHPPVPPENRNPHDADVHPNDSAASTGMGDKETKNPDKHGQQANTRQNTTHQGYQQDR